MCNVDSLTPRAFRCPACGAHERMEIVWPFWRCSRCHTRLIPADHSANGNGGLSANDNGRPVAEELIEYYL